MKSMVRKKFAAAVWFVCMFMLLLGCTAKNIQSEEQFAAVQKQYQITVEAIREWQQEQN